MTGKINTADLSYYYEPENFDGIVKAVTEKHVSWSPTIATWYRPLSPSVARFKERELSILDRKEASYLPGVLREQALGQYERYAKFPPERLNNAREGYKNSRILSAVMFRRAVSSAPDRIPIMACQDSASIKRW